VAPVEVADEERVVVAIPVVARSTVVAVRRIPVDVVVAARLHVDTAIPVTVTRDRTGARRGVAVDAVAALVATVVASVAAPLGAAVAAVALGKRLRIAALAVLRRHVATAVVGRRGVSLHGVALRLAATRVGAGLLGARLL